MGLNTPQTWSSCRHRRVSGLSPAARWLAVLQSATWLTYGVLGDVPVQVATNAVCVVLHTAVLVALLALSPQSRTTTVLLPQAGLSALWLAVVAGSALTGALPVGVLAAGVGCAALVPQVWRLAQRTGADTSGVSRTTVRLTLLSSTCWTAHGLLVGAVEVAATSLLGAIAATATLALLRQPAPAAGSGTATVTALIPAQRSRPAGLTPAVAA